MKLISFQHEVVEYFFKAYLFNKTSGLKNEEKHSTDLLTMNYWLSAIRGIRDRYSYFILMYKSGGTRCMNLMSALPSIEMCIPLKNVNCEEYCL